MKPERQAVDAANDVTAPCKWCGEPTPTRDTAECERHRQLREQVVSEPEVVARMLGAVRRSHRGMKSSKTGLSAETMAHADRDFDVVYVAVDLETDGPIPGVNSMRNMGAVALNLDNVLLGTWTANLEPLPGAIEDPTTMAEFWDKNPEAWEAVNRNRRNPGEAIGEYVAWLGSLPTRPTLSVYPTWDAGWHWWYLNRFAGKDPTGFAAFDAKSYAAGVLRLPFRASSKRNYPPDWYDQGLTHTHLGLDDALGQGVMHVNAIRQSLGLPPRPLTRSAVQET